MTTNNTVQDPIYERITYTLEDGEDLISHLRKLRNNLVMNPDEEFKDLDNIIIQNYRAYSDAMDQEDEETEQSGTRAFLIHEKTRYDFVNRFARLLLSRETIHDDEFIDYLVQNLFSESMYIDAVMLLVKMHLKWLHREKAPLILHPALDGKENTYSERIRMIDNCDKAILSLDPSDESEGTLRFLFHDYCRNMIIYDCALDLNLGVYDEEAIRNAYGDYTDEAKVLCKEMSERWKGGEQIELL